MTSHGHRRQRPTAPRAAAATAETSAYRKLVREWRDEWRAEVAARRARENGAAPPAANGVAETNGVSRAAKARRDDAARFAAAVARDAFGRFYWSGEEERELAKVSGGKRRGDKRRRASVGETR